MNTQAFDMGKAAYQRGDWAGAVSALNGAKAAGTPLIATMASEKHILVNILSASTRAIEDRAYGSMLLGVPGGPDVVKETIEYLTGVPDVIVEEV